MATIQTEVLNLNLENPFKNAIPSRHWYEGFRKRHPEISSKKVQNLSKVRAQVTAEDLKQWFADVQKYRHDHNLLNLPKRSIFNADVTNILVCPSPGYVLAPKGNSAVYRVTNENDKEGYTVLFNYNSAGEAAPPLVLYPFKDVLPRKIAENFTSDWAAGISHSGWMKSDNFFEYVANVFYPWLVKEKVPFPVIFFVNGHKSHITLPLIKFCIARRIVVIQLFPNATHICQPLDVSFFHPLKLFWAVFLPWWKTKNNVSNITKENFVVALKACLYAFFAKNMVINGFRTTGLEPFNPNAIDYNVLKKNHNKKRKTVLSNNASQADEDFVSTQENLKLLADVEKNIPSYLLVKFYDAHYWLKIKS